MRLRAPSFFGSYDFFNSSRFLLNLIEPISYRYNIKKLAAYCSLIGSLGYLLLTGMQIAATRAFIMTAVATLAIIISRTPFPMGSLALAAFIILLFNPEFVINPSFQLSFIAVVSLISGYEFYLKNSRLFGSSKGIFASLRLYLISNIYSCLIASLATAPIVTYHFYIFSNYSIPANLVAVPLMSFIIMPIGLLAFFTIPLPTGDIFFTILNYSITTIKTLAEYIVSLPKSIIYTGHISASSVTIFFIGFLWLTLWQTRIRLLSVFPLLISFILALNSPNPRLVVNFNHPFLLINNKDSLQAIAPYLSPFSKNFIANWFGFKELKLHKLKPVEAIKLVKSPANLLTFSSSATEKEYFGEIDFINKRINLGQDWQDVETSIIFIFENNRLQKYPSLPRFEFYKSKKNEN